MADEIVALKYVARKTGQLVGGAIAGFACGLIIVGINETSYKVENDSTSGILQPNETVRVMFGLTALGFVSGLFM